MSRIFYRKRFFDYPLKPWNALRNLGVFTSIGCVASYAWVRLFPRRPERSFEDWVTNRFGRRLFNIFFRTYTEKVWGIPTSELSADWAAQRIKGLSLSKAIVNAFRGAQPDGEGGAVIKTLIDTFDYPRLGPGVGRFCESAGDRPQRHAQIQQPGSLDDDGVARRAEFAGRKL